MFIVRLPRKWSWLFILLIVVLVVSAVSVTFATRQAESEPTIGAWSHISTRAGRLAKPSSSTQQTASLVLDIDRDGVNDFVIGIRKKPGPSLVWYRRTAGGWDKYLIDADPLDIEAGGAFYDIDGDGDLDIVMGGDSRSNQVWWWENPYPNYAPDVGWTRRLIKDGGAEKHHDQIFGDFDGDGQVELVFWNQRAKTLFLAEIPADPRATQPWPLTPIYTWSGGGEHEGLAAADMDNDGVLDIVGGGRWFKHTQGNEYQTFVIDDAMAFTRAAAGQLIPGGRPEVVFVTGDGVGPIKWYRWDGSAWIGASLLGEDVDHGHSLQILDFNGDGHLDVFNAEMRLNGDNKDAKARIFLGDGAGHFIETVAVTGYGNHESKMADLDGDGDYDILGKPYNWETPRLDIWLNESACGKTLDRWQRRVVDGNRPNKAIFVDAADLTGDGLPEIVAGGWWYKNPGIASGSWKRQAIGAPLNNMAALYDFDGDGDMDILGTEGKGSNANANFVWARNDGDGNFTILDNIEAGDGDFLQGVAVDRFSAGGPLTVVLSWHAGGKGIQALTVPADPSSQTWTWSRIADVSQDEQLSAGDIDRDGDVDLLLGTKWLRNEGDVWTVQTLHETDALPDRNRLADINGDGRLDAVVGYESTASAPTPLAWYAQPPTATDRWAETVIARPVAPMSVDVRDMDNDGDLDVIAGEHNLKSPSDARMLIYENVDGQGREWRETVVYTGDEHHDGARVVDIDRDGDLDIISIGWTHGRVALYENQSPGCERFTGPPAILEQSQDVTGLVGLSVPVDVKADGARPLSYEWRRDGSIIPGAELATLWLHGLKPSDDGANLSCVVANAWGEANCDAVTLRVKEIAARSYLPLVNQVE